MKKKCFLPIALAAIMLLPILASAGIGNNQVTYTATYSNSNMTIGSDTLGGIIYSTVRYGDLYNGGGPGTPSLPIDYIKFSVPYNATNFTVTAAMIGWSNQNLNHMLYPCQRPILTDGSDTLTITLPDSTVYYSGEYYPSLRAKVVNEGFLAGENHIVTVALMPFRYKHTSTADILSKVSRCIVTLRYELSDSLAMYPIIRRDSLLREEGYQLTQTMVVNPNKVKDFAPTQTFALGIDSIGFIQGITGDLINGGLPDPTPVDPGEFGEEELHIDGGNYTYLIVTTSELKHAVRRIAALKRQKGYNVKIVTMEEVMQDTIARHGDYVNGHIAYDDNAGRLRQFLRQSYENKGTKYVLLAGTDVPYRETTHILPEKPITFQSDLYYGDLTADWFTGQFDKNSELYIGRILAVTEEQIYNYTDKLYRYEMNPGKGSYGYLKNAFYSQGFDMRLWHEIDTIRNSLDRIYPNPFIMQETDNLNEHSSYPSGRDIITELNQTNYSFISLHHHGFPSSLLTCGLRDGKHKSSYRFLWAIDTVRIAGTGWIGDDTLTKNGLNNMSNKDYPNICYSTSCITIPYTLPAYYLNEGVKINFGESFTTGKDYGGPAFFGNTKEGYTPTSAYLERAVTFELANGNCQLGKANAIGKSNFQCEDFDEENINYVSAVQNLLGDPTLELWTEIPTLYDFVTITRYNDSITVNGLNGNPATITVCNINGGITSRYSTTDITIKGVSPNAIATLHRQNYIPFIAPIFLQNISIIKSQYVIANDVTAGQSVEEGRSTGDVTVKNGVEFEIESMGTVTLNDGFSVEKGGLFAIYPSIIK